MSCELSEPIRGQYSGHVTCLSQSEASIQVSMKNRWGPKATITIVELKRAVGEG